MKNDAIIKISGLQVVDDSGESIETIGVSFLFPFLSSCNSELLNLMDLIVL